MVDWDYSGMTKPLERARRDAAREAAKLPAIALMDIGNFPVVDFPSFVATDFFRAECPSLADCYRRATKVALLYGWKVPSKAKVKGFVEGVARAHGFASAAAYRAALVRS